MFGNDTSIQNRIYRYTYKRYFVSMSRINLSQNSYTKELFNLRETRYAVNDKQLPVPLEPDQFNNPIY